VVDPSTCHGGYLWVELIDLRYHGRIYNIGGDIWIYALYALFIFVRMGNYGHLIVCVYAVFLGFMALLASQYIGSGQDQMLNSG